MAGIDIRLIVREVTSREGNEAVLDINELMDEVAKNVDLSAIPREILERQYKVAVVDNELNKLKYNSVPKTSVWINRENCKIRKYLVAVKEKYENKSSVLTAIAEDIAQHITEINMDYMKEHPNQFEIVIKDGTCGYEEIIPLSLETVIDYLEGGRI